jgi:hypothetical protein
MVHWRVQVRAYRLASVDMAAVHAVRPGDIVGERGQHAVYVPRVEAIVETLEEFDVIVHYSLLAGVALEAKLHLHMHVCISGPVGARGEAPWISMCSRRLDT